jgi:hypothetical protein
LWPIHMTLCWESYEWATTLERALEKHLALYPATGIFEAWHDAYAYPVSNTPFTIVYRFDDQELRSCSSCTAMRIGDGLKQAMSSGDGWWEQRKSAHLEEADIDAEGRTGT